MKRHEAWSASERAFGIEALRLVAPRAERLAARLFALGDPRALIERAERAGLLPTFASTCERAGVFERAPAELRRAFQAALARNEMQNRLLLDEAARASALLSAADVPSVVLKGAALAALDARALRARHIDDVDLLVRPQDAERAQEALLRAGFVEKRTGPGQLVDWSGALLVTPPARWRHQLSPVVSPRGVMIEVHTRTRGSAEEPWAEWERLHRGARAVDAGRGRVIVPSLDELLAQTSAHVVVHHQMDPAYWPRHLVDVQLLLDLGAGRACAPDPEARRAVQVARALRRAALDDATAPERLVAELFVLPTRRAQRLHGARELGRMLGRAAGRGPGTLYRSLWPSRAFLDEVSAKRGQGLSPQAPLALRRAARLVQLARERLS